MYIYLQFVDLKIKNKKFIISFVAHVTCLMYFFSRGCRFYSQEPLNKIKFLDPSRAKFATSFEQGYASQKRRNFTKSLLKFHKKLSNPSRIILREKTLRSKQKPKEFCGSRIRVCAFLYPCPCHLWKQVWADHPEPVHTELSIGKVHLAVTGTATICPLALLLIDLPAATSYR